MSAETDLQTVRIYWGILRSEDHCTEESLDVFIG